MSLLVQPDASPDKAQSTAGAAPQPGTLVSIRNLVLSYTGRVEDRVLEIAHLDVPPGKLVFLLGSSGSGKSTLLEALGLMNRTGVSGKLHFSPAGGPPVDLVQAWEGPDAQTRLGLLRRRYFSFIFQNTNLMDNFTAYENVCLSQMIQQGQPQSKALEGARTLMDSVGLPISQVSEGKMAANLSGGQRQRLAFVRALNTDFTLLMGDEPTGNLDEANAHELMRVIRRNLAGNRAALVVSHDIDLALAHADTIIVLSKDAGGVGQIHTENVFERDSWAASEQSAAALKARIAHLYQAAAAVADRTVPAKADKSDEAGHVASKAARHFPRLFFDKEGRALLGRGARNWTVLTGIMLLALLAIGFANGSLAYLKEKLENPFVRWLTITIPLGRADAVNMAPIIAQLRDPGFAQRYHVRGISTYKKSVKQFAAPNSTKPIEYRGRDFDMAASPPDPMLPELLRPENTLYPDPAERQARAFADNEEVSVIVTEKLIRELGFDLDNPPTHIGFPRAVRTGEVVARTLPFPIRAIVKDMPGGVNFAYTRGLTIRESSENDESMDVERHTRTLVLALQADSAEALKIKTILEQTLDKISVLQKDTVSAYVQKPLPYPYTWRQPVRSIHIEFYPIPSADKLAAYAKAILSAPQLAAYKDRLTQIYSYDQDRSRTADVLDDVISVYFDDLDSVRQFADSFEAKANAEAATDSRIEVDRAKVIEKENFRYLAHVIQIVSWLLATFAVVAVVLFLSNLLTMHLAKVRMNIGTFKAFGLADGEAQRIYFLITVAFLLSAIFFAWLASWLIGSGMDIWFRHLYGSDEDRHYFVSFYLFTYVCMGLVGIFGLVVARATIQKMLSKTPGDLIYNR